MTNTKKQKDIWKTINGAHVLVSSTRKSNKVVKPKTAKFDDINELPQKKVKSGTKSNKKKGIF